MSKQKWSRDSVIEAIKSLSCTSDNYTNTNHKDIYNAGIRYFGSWKHAVLAATGDYKTVNKQWTKEEIVCEIAKLQSVHCDEIKRDNPKLYWAAERIFKSWRSAVIAAGRKPIKTNFNEQEALKQLQSIPNKTASSLNDAYPALYGSILNHFAGGLKEALSKIGIDYAGVRLNDCKTDEQILSEMRGLKEYSYTFMKLNYPKLYYVAKSRFGSWKEALHLIGVEYDDRRYSSEFALYGVIKEVFIGQKIIRNYRGIEWLVNPKTNMPLEIDFYLPQLNLAIEYQGIQHFKPRTKFGGKDGLKQTQERDAIKRQLLKEHGTKLVEICYYDKINKDVVLEKVGIQ
jgi:hypothetical protein